MTVLCPLPPCNHTDQPQKRPLRQLRPHSTRSRRSDLTPTPQSAEDIFLHALARASLCRKHATSLSTSWTPSRSYSSHSRTSSTRPPSHFTHSDLQSTHSRSASTHSVPQSTHSALHTTCANSQSKHSRSHSTHSTSHARPSSPTRTSSVRQTSHKSSRFSINHGSKDAAHAVAALPREELRGIVDLYDYDYDTEDWNTPTSPNIRIALPVPVEDIPSPPVHIIPDTSANPAAPSRQFPDNLHDHQDHISNLVALLEDDMTPHDSIFDAYQHLPHPRISYLSDQNIRLLMHRFTIVEFRTEQSMLRYLSLVDDLTAADIPLTTTEWNSAINFAGRWVRRVGDVQVDTATQIWLRMEREAGVKSDNVTFNILFDIAAKAGKFALAEVIMQEMVTRELPENRYFRTNKIFYYGLKRDGAAVRQAYKELVDAGEFVDTVVLNCVIASLIKAGEASAAEHIFDRMKAMHAEKTGSRPIASNWRNKRDLGRVLDKAARTLRKQPEQRKLVQEATPITPDIHTYRLLIKYHAHESGNIDRVTDLLDELHEVGIQIHGSVFFQLFRGFQLHGGVRYSSWTKSRLDKLWAVFHEFVERTNEYNRTREPVLYEEDKGCYYDSGVVIVVLQAYDRVAGKDAAMEVWEDIMDKWKPEAEALDEVNRALANMFAGRME